MTAVSVLDNPVVLGRWSLVAALTISLQDALMWRLSVFGVHPELPLLVAVTAGVVIGARRGCIVGFWVGLLSDAVSGPLLGVNAFTLCLVGYGAGVSDELLLADDAISRVIQIAVGSAAAILIQAAVGEVFGRPYMSGGSFVRIAVGVGLLHAPLGPLAVRVVEWAEPEER